MDNIKKICHFESQPISHCGRAMHRWYSTNTSTGHTNHHCPQHPIGGTLVFDGGHCLWGIYGPSPPTIAHQRHVGAQWWVGGVLTSQVLPPSHTNVWLVRRECKMVGGLDLSVPHQQCIGWESIMPSCTNAALMPPTIHRKCTPNYNKSYQCMSIQIGFKLGWFIKPVNLKTKLHHKLTYTLP